MVISYTPVGMGPLRFTHVGLFSLFLMGGTIGIFNCDINLYAAFYSSYRDEE